MGGVPYPRNHWKWVAMLDKKLPREKSLQVPSRRRTTSNSKRTGNLTAGLVAGSF